MRGADTPFVTTLAPVGGVILGATLRSGLVGRGRSPQVAVFRALGVALGTAALARVHVPLDAPLPRAVAGGVEGG